MLSENIFEVDICLTCTYYWHIGNIFGNGAFAFRKGLQYFTSSFNSNFTNLQCELVE